MEPCSHRPPCPGCPRFGQRGVTPTVTATLEALCARAGITPAAVVDGSPTGFRHRARLAVRGRARAPKIGIFETGSHRIVDIPHCVVHHPQINAVARAIKAAVRATGTAPYDDDAHRGQLRYVQLVLERPSGRVQVVLVGNDIVPAPLEPLANALGSGLEPSLHSLWWNGQPERSNAILGPHWHRFTGPVAVQERIGDAAVFFPPGAFGQSHLMLADRIVAQVHAWVPAGARVAELYAGCGPIGLGLVARSARVQFNEVAPGGLEGLRYGIDALPAQARERASIHPGPAPEHAGLIRDADIVIADPPRKGLDAAVLDALIATPPARYIAVSCDLASFEREAAALQGSGRMRLSELVPVALFPYTDHVETVALFERIGS